MTLSPGQILDNRYRIVKLLGQGGFGAVYRAWDVNLVEPAALRVMAYFAVPGQGQYPGMDYVEGEDLQEMLLRVGGRCPKRRYWHGSGRRHGHYARNEESTRGGITDEPQKST